MSLNGLLGTKAGRERLARPAVPAPPVWEDCWDSFLVPRRHGAGHEALPRHPLSQEEAASLRAPESTELSGLQRRDKAARWWIQSTDGHGCVVAGSGVGVAGPPEGVAISADRCQHRRAFIPAAPPSRHRLSQSSPCATVAERPECVPSCTVQTPLPRLRADGGLHAREGACRPGPRAGVGNAEGLGLPLQLNHPRHGVPDRGSPGAASLTLLSLEGPRLPRGLA